MFVKFKLQKYDFDQIVIIMQLEFWRIFGLFFFGIDEGYCCLDKFQGYYILGLCLNSLCYCYIKIQIFGFQVFGVCLDIGETCDRSNVNNNVVYEF